MRRDWAFSGNSSGRLPTTRLRKIQFSTSPSAETHAPLASQPEVVQSTILIDPATICLQHADVVRNFFRMKCRTAAEVFFQYFACEKGIGLFMSRYVLWNEAIVRCLLLALLSADADRLVVAGLRSKRSDSPRISSHPSL